MNIVFVGMPGSGKTKIGKLIAEKFGRDFVDVDDYIEEATGRDSADHLAELGDDDFLDFESRTSEQIFCDDGVIATTGSNPLRADGIDHLRGHAPSFTIWMDVPLPIIESRVGQRKDGDSRIVGAQTMTFEEILAWRREAYEDNHDHHFQISEEKPVEEVAAEILKILAENGVC